MKERLQKILSSRGIASRRMAEKMIDAGRVTCNGKISAVGDSADPDIDDIRLDGVPLPQKADAVYILLHKPRGYVTTLSDEKGRKDVSLLVSDCGHRVYPIGRLDMDSEGLLLLTNDGEFANRMMHPKHEINKVYLTYVSGYSDDALQRLRKPVTLDGYTIRTPSVEVIKVSGDRAIISVTIHEGRNRQVRRMCAIAGMNVQRLKRISEGSIQLGDLPVGKWRFLNQNEIAELRKEN